MRASLFIAIFSAVIPLTAHAEAEGAPGAPYTRGPALKQAVGTAFERQGAISPVWFTVSDGILGEVFYPTLDQAQLGEIQFLVADGKYYFSDPRRDASPEVSYVDEGMTVRITGREHSGKYSYEETIVTDPAAPVVRIQVRFKWKRPGLKLYLLFRPAIGGSGQNNLVEAGAQELFATRAFREGEAPVAAVLRADAPFARSAAGYVGVSDGIQELFLASRITNASKSAGPGNTATIAQLVSAGMGDSSETKADLALAFGATRAEATAYASTSQDVRFDQVRADYEAGWHDYLRTLVHSPVTAGRRFLLESTFARRSAQLIKMHEDKSRRGAIVSSLAQNQVSIRQLYRAASALLAAGDVETAEAALEFMQKADSAAMDEVADLVLLVAELHSRAGLQLGSGLRETVRKAIATIVAHGPQTSQDRWGGTGGYVPSTLAAELAALRAGAELIGDSGALIVADRWQSMIERWTLVTGDRSSESHYIRSNPNVDAMSEPDENAPTSILDGGFLELVRLGVRGANDPRILSSLTLYDDPEAGLARTEEISPEAALYRRFEGDADGPGAAGGFWPVLAGERGHYAVAAGDEARASAQLFLMEKTATPAGLLPQQVQLDPTTSASTGYAADIHVACPFVWAHAEDILLHRSIEEGRPFDSPELRTQGQVAGHP